MASTGDEAQPEPAAPPTPAAPTATAASSDQQGPEVRELCNDMFEKIANYVEHELKGTCDEYALLKQLNTLACGEYSDMQAMMASLNVEMEQLDAKYAELQPYFEQIDGVVDSVDKLANAAKYLDDYSRRLEAKFKSVIRK